VGTNIVRAWILSLWRIVGNETRKTGKGLIIDGMECQAKELKPYLRVT
jgi:hypothetical protein